MAQTKTTRVVLAGSSEYSWTLSGSGTANYYLLKDGGDPAITDKPDDILLSDVSISEGTLGSLNADEWAYGDNDSLGFSTVYLRITGDTDPGLEDYGAVKMVNRVLLNSFSPMTEYAGGSGGKTRSANGDEVSADTTPTVALSAVYNLIPSNGRTYTDGVSGSVTASDRTFECRTGTTLFGYGALQSFRALNHKNGLGVTLRFSGEFPDAVANSWLGIGGIAIGDEVSFGLNGLEFGVWHRYKGLPEVHTLTLTGGAGGSENASVTLNGTLYTVPLTAGTVQHNAFEIVSWFDANVDVWAAESIDDVVVFSAQSDGAKAGAYSFSSSTATGTITQTTAGVTKTSDFTCIRDWNGQVLNNFDWTKGNNYQIKYVNGFGVIQYFIENPETGRYQLVHSIRSGNQGSTENFANPSLRVGCYAYSVGSTTDVGVKCSYLAGFIDGIISSTRNPRGYGNVKSVATTLTSLFQLRNLRNYNGLPNQSEIRPLYITLTNDTTRNAIFELRGNPTVAGDFDWQTIGNNLFSVVDTSGGVVTEGTGRELASFTVARLSSEVIDLTNLKIAIPPTLRVAVCAKKVGGSADDLGASVTWYEDL